MFNPIIPVNNIKTNEDEENVNPIQKRRPHLKAHVFPLPKDYLDAVKSEHAKGLNPHVSVTELVSFMFDDTNNLLYTDRDSICVEYFSYTSINHNSQLVEFYTGLPDSNTFFVICTMLEKAIFRDYVRWDDHEKMGFKNHTMMTLMKLRLGMSDEEIAERFKVEKHVVNMTMRLWIPAMYKKVYKYCEELYQHPPTSTNGSFTKVIDIVEICIETPEYMRERGGRNQTRHAVLCVRSDGFVCFAGDVVSEHRPGDVCIQKSGFSKVTTAQDIVLAHPDLQQAVSSLGVTCHGMTEDASLIMESAANNIADYKILVAIPLEYASFASYIYKICAALTNFILMPADE